jgi:c-di-GMP-binding flagellar brake protein YcgR
MRFNEAAAKMADNQSERQAQKGHQAIDTEDPGPARVPFRIDDAMMVRSLTNASHMARTRIIGAMHGKYVLIIEPTMKINDRISAVLDEDFLCSYFNEGAMHIFNSRYLRHLEVDVVSIAYPTKVEVRQIRRHRRIRVNIETKCTVSGTVDVFSTEMADISKGGCRLILNERAPITKGSNLSLAFNLPNTAFVSGLQTVVARIGRIPNSRTTEIGVSFTGPESEISKIMNFCEFCMYFDLEESPTQI